jgi:ABC-type lipoprotein release transport system permease subunit
MLLQLAWRNIWRNKTRSAVIVTSVALGILAGAFMMSFYFGMGTGRVKIAIEHEVSHLQIHHPDFQADQEAAFSFDAQIMSGVLRKDPRIQAFSNRSVSSGMLANAAGTRGVFIVGIEPEAENRTRPLATFVREGSFLDSAGAKNQILVSTKLAEKLKLALRSKVVLTFQDTAHSLVSGAFRICGFYQSENAPLDERHIFIRKNELDALLGTSGRAHETAILLKNEDDLETLRSDLRAHFPDLKTESWREISPETDLVISSLDSFSLVFIAIILLALMFGIVNTMLMAVLERTREIGMLMAIGMTKIRLFLMILLETFFLTLAGTPIGLFMALALIGWLGKRGIDFSSFAGQMMSDFGYAQVIYPQLPLKNMIQMLLLVIVAAFLSAIFPARKALKLRPAEAIRQ